MGRESGREGGIGREGGRDGRGSYMCLPLAYHDTMRPYPALLCSCVQFCMTDSLDDFVLDRSERSLRFCLCGIPYVLTHGMLAACLRAFPFSFLFQPSKELLQ